MSGTGISPAWVQNSGFKFGDLWLFDPETIHSIFTQCNFAFLGDVNPTITILVSCTTEGENPDVFHDMTVGCDTTFLGDVNPIITMSITIMTSVSGP